MKGAYVDLVTIAIVLGLLAVLYGFVTSRQVLGSPAGNEKMQEIAAAVGLHDESHFVRDFKSLYGYTPTERRRTVLANR